MERTGGDREKLRKGLGERGKADATQGPEVLPSQRVEPEKVVASEVGSWVPLSSFALTLAQVSSTCSH